MSAPTADAEPEDFSLAPGEVRLWWVDLSVSAETSERLERRLASDERERAARFVFARDRRRFAVAHAALRFVLGRYLQRVPAELSFAPGPKGKPRLAAPAEEWLRFNLTHSHEAALIACAREREVGVDLEWMRDEVAVEEIVASTFSTAEQDEWRALPPAARREFFFHGWVRKEAYVKALGEGLSRATESYTVRLGPTASTALLEDSLQPGAETRWSLAGLSVPAGYAAALCVAGPATAVRWAVLNAEKF